ncbi:MAG: hypothetical protein Ct9H300mP1_36180 [Planctomycetaceae bacterium]|nr:MAG: hypothetical protein Ct9H300mP1_36180 [Planctomycetaceae bacterium]
MVSPGWSAWRSKSQHRRYRLGTRIRRHRLDDICHDIRGGASRWLLPVMTTLWGVRLSGHLAVRNLGKGEDKRYAEMRSRRGPRFAFTSLVIVFGLQGVVMWLVAFPCRLESTGGIQLGMGPRAGVAVVVHRLLFRGRR